MPMVADDPISASWTLSTSHEGTAMIDVTVSEAKLSYGTLPVTQLITTEPSAFSVAPGAFIQPFTKTAALDDLADDCGYCDQGVVLDLQLEYGDSSLTVTSAKVLMTCSH